MFPRTLFAALALSLAFARPVAADVAVPAVFSDHTVLQSGVAAPVFGKAAPAPI